MGGGSWRCSVKVNCQKEGLGPAQGSTDRAERSEQGFGARLPGCTLGFITPSLGNLGSILICPLSDG